MILGVDIGATKTLIALFSTHGHILRRRRFLTSRDRTTFLLDLKNNLKSFQKFHPTMVIIAVPGTVQKNCSVHFGNRPWKKFDLEKPVKNLFSCPIFLENDASLGALYESQKYPGLTVYLTFSTGIGGGLARNGILLPESAALESGHKLYTFKGQTKEWEDIASASAIGKSYHTDKITSLRDKEVMKDIAARLDLGLPDIISEYSPNQLIIGGAVGKILPRVLPFLETDFSRIFPARRPFESTIYGCFAYAQQKLV